MDNSKSRLVFLDIDGTLFDYVRYKVFLRNKISEILKVSATEFEQIYRKSIDETRKKFGVFVPDFYLQQVIKNSNSQVSTSDLYNEVFAPPVIENFLFPDVSHFLEQASVMAELGVLSKGHPSYQGLKIKNFSKLLRSDKTYILSDKKGEAFRIVSESKDYKVYFIDNDPETLEAYKDQGPSWTTILIERYEPLEYNGVSDFRIKSLLEAIEIIEK
ncbi:MAG: hypothetical protein AAB801_03475 [Patescibacteria group bacterium]